MNTFMYIKELEIPYLSEMLAEVYDNYADMLTDGSVVFGQPISSIIAGMSMQGRLSIAVCQEEYKTLCNNFAQSSKWSYVLTKEEAKAKIIRDERKKNQLNQIHHGSNHDSNFKRLLNGERSRIGPPKHKGFVPNHGASSFKTIDEVEIRIFSSPEKTIRPIDSAFWLVRQSLWTFASICMDNDGRVFEVIPGAEEDCKNRILRLDNPNKFEKNNLIVNIKRIRNTLKRFTRSGWKSEKEPKEIIKELNKLEALKKRKEKTRRDYLLKELSNVKMVKIDSKNYRFELSVTLVKLLSIDVNRLYKDFANYCGQKGHKSSFVNVREGFGFVSTSQVVGKRFFVDYAAKITKKKKKRPQAHHVDMINEANADIPEKHEEIGNLWSGSEVEEPPNFQFDVKSAVEAYEKATENNEEVAADLHKKLVDNLAEINEVAKEAPKTIPGPVGVQKGSYQKSAWAKFK